MLTSHRCWWKRQTCPVKSGWNTGVSESAAVTPQQYSAYPRSEPRETSIIIRHIDRDMDYEAELIEMERCFWHDNVLSKVPPPYTEDGELILESLRRQLGPSDKDAPPAVLAMPQ